MAEMIEPPDSRPRPGFREHMRHFWDRSRGSLSLLMVYACVGVFVFLWLLDLFGIASRAGSADLLGLSYAGLFADGRLHQVATSPLVHVSIGHLLFNMLGLWIIGPPLETSLGRRRYVILSLLSALCSMLGFLVLDRGRGYILMGYSGVLSGLFMGLFYCYPEHQVYFWFVARLKVKHAVWLFLAVQLYMLTSGQGAGTVYACHLFGALAALAYLFQARWWGPLRRRVLAEADRRRRRRRRRMSGRSAPDEL